MNAGAGFVEAAPDINLNLRGALEISTGDPQPQSSGFAATLTGFGGLTKTGDGGLILSGKSGSWTGNTLVNQGTLRVTSADALGAAFIPAKIVEGGNVEVIGSITTVQEPTCLEARRSRAGGTLELSGGITVSEPIDLAGGTLVSSSGANTLTNRILLLDSSTVKVQQDSLTLDPSSGEAVAVHFGSAAFNSNLSWTVMAISLSRPL